MPHLLRSTTSPENYNSAVKVIPRFPAAGVPAVPRGRRTVDPISEPLRRQVSSIIDAILSDTKPEEAQVREKLRWHVANNPGQPEKALLSHLLSVSVEQDAS